jgi:UDP-glucose 4-epimerase
MKNHAKVAIIGGTGFIGSHLAEYLLAHGHQVLSVSRGRRSEIAALCHPRLTHETADIRDRSSIHAALRTYSPEVVYHLASEPDGTESPAFIEARLDSNAKGTVNTLLATIDCGARLFVYGDSSKVYGNGPVPYRANQPEAPICSYAIAKAAGWHLCSLLAAQADVKIVSLRPTLIYGPRQNFNLLTYVEQTARKNQPITIQGGAQTRDLLYIEDAVRCFASMMNAPAAWGRSLPIGGGFEINIMDLCHEILDVLGCNLEVREDARAVRSTEIWRSYCDNSDISHCVAWSPRISLKDGLRRTFAATLTAPQPFFTLEPLAV